MKLWEKSRTISVIGFVRNPRIKWIEYVTKRDEDDISKTAMNQNPTGKRL